MAPPAAQGRNGWDGKLRVGELNGNTASDSEGESDAEAEGQHEAVGGNSQVVNGSSRTAVVRQGETVPGEQIEADEDLMAEYEDDTEEVELSHCRISSISKLGLGRLKHLTRLGLRQNAVQAIELPEDLSGTLEDLDLYDNLIKDISGLENFAELKSLDLSFNKIKRIKGVSHLKKLKDLYFVQDRISTIENLDGLESLRNLELGGNRIRVSSERMVLLDCEC
jgi:protein phosphatase 1 regulatory subunit 7